MEFYNKPYVKYLKKYTNNPYFVIGTIVVLTLFSRWVHDGYATLWGTPEVMNRASARLAKLEEQLKSEGVGDWIMDKSQPMTKLVVDTLECEAYINGSFLNRRTNERVNAFIVLGPPGPIAVHTPEVCYSSDDYETKEEREATPIHYSDDAQDQFWGLTMRSQDLNRELLRVYYAWSAGDHWTASYSPRISYGGEDFLFKFQLAAYLPPDTDLETGDSCRKFLTAVVPLVNQAILQDQEEPAATDQEAEVQEAELQASGE